VGKKVLLTEAGEALLQHANRILTEMTAARQCLEQLGKWGRARLRIGASPTACQYILPAILREFKERFPKCLITIAPGDALEAIELVRSNKVDLALTLEPHREESMEFHPLFADELKFIVSPAHPWAQLGHAVRAEIPRQNYVLYNKNSYTFRGIQEYFREEDMVLNTVIELGSMEAIKELVKLGLGVSILSPWIARKELQENSLVALPLGKRKLRRKWGVIHWRDRRLSLPEETLLALCRSATAELKTEPAAQATACA
jgi:DNA-binding transcriptional LysR family regulator